MAKDETITSGSLGRRPAAIAPGAPPQLVVIALADDLRMPSSRHLLDEVDEVRFARGARGVVRRIVDRKRVLELRFPDRRMSSEHGRLVRGPRGWLLDDPRSKNGTIVDGVVTRRAQIENGVVIEVGHTSMMFRIATVETGSPHDRDEPATPSALDSFDGVLAERFAALAKIARTTVPVLVRGAIGTGKEMIARAVHALSGRPGAFVAVNCGALPWRLIEAEMIGRDQHVSSDRLVRNATAGTLFLDDVGELPPASQVTFLRMLQERDAVALADERSAELDLRLCCATVVDLERLTSAGAFRLDLYARLAAFSIDLPPLRSRAVDLGVLMRRALDKIPGGTGVRMTPAALRQLLRHDWPLNLRELEHTLATATALAIDGTIDVAQLPSELPRLEPGNALMPELQRERLVELLRAHHGNVIAVGKALGVRRTQVYRWIRRFGIALDGFRA